MKIFLNRKGRKQTKTVWFLNRGDPWPVAGKMSCGNRKMSVPGQLKKGI